MPDFGESVLSRAVSQKVVQSLVEWFSLQFWCTATCSAIRYTAILPISLLNGWISTYELRWHEFAYTGWLDEHRQSDGQATQYWSSFPQLPQRRDSTDLIVVQKLNKSNSVDQKALCGWRE